MESKELKEKCTLCDFRGECNDGANPCAVCEHELETSLSGVCLHCDGFEDCHFERKK